MKEMKEMKEQWDRMEIASDGIDDARPRRRSTAKMVIAAVGAALLLVLCSIRTVAPATTGIVVTLGAVADDTIDSGLHVVNPIARVIPIKLKTQLLYSENQVPTQEGLNVELDVSLLYHVDPKHAREIFLKLGENYEEILIMPTAICSAGTHQ